MHKKIFFIILFFLPTFVIAQGNNQYQVVLENLYAGEAINTYDLRERKEYNQVFLNEDWQKSKLIFSDNEVSSRTYWLKYDILNQEVNIRIGEEAIYIVPKNRIHGFIFLSDIDKKILENSQFMVSQKRKTKGDIYEIIVDGKYSLAILHEAEKLKSNYIPALDTGNISEKIITKKKFFLITDKKAAIEISKKKKSATKLFNKYTPSKEYLKKNKVNFKKQKDLEGIILFMNNQLKNKK